MEITVNKPLAETFGWLQAGAKRIDLQDKIQNISYVLGPGESRVLFLEDPGASEYEITLGEGARLQPAEGLCQRLIYCDFHQPIAPFISMRIRLFISTAYSRGSSLETFSAKPLTISALASSSESPLLIR